MYDHAFNPKGGTNPPAAALEQRTAETHLAVREALRLAAARLGGAGALHKWIRHNKENEKIFWSALYMRLLPLEADGEGEMGERMEGLVATWLPPQ